MKYIQPSKDKPVKVTNEAARRLIRAGVATMKSRVGPSRTPAKRVQP